MKSKVDQFDAHTLVPVPVDLKKLSDVIDNDVVTKTDCSTKLGEIGKKILDHDHDKYITTQEFNKFASENFDVRL